MKPRPLTVRDLREFLAWLDATPNGKLGVFEDHKLDFLDMRPQDQASRDDVTVGLIHGFHFDQFDEQVGPVVSLVRGPDGVLGSMDWPRPAVKP